MPDPTAAEALTALAAELDDLATAHWPVGTDYTKAAGLARNHARLIAERAAEPSVTTGEGPATGSRYGTLRAAADAVHEEMGGPAAPDPWTLARAALAAAEPFIRAREREQIARLAEEHKATYRAPCTVGGMGSSAAPFARLIRDQP